MAFHLCTHLAPSTAVTVRPGLFIFIFFPLSLSLWRPAVFWRRGWKRRTEVCCPDVLCKRRPPLHSGWTRKTNLASGFLLLLYFKPTGSNWEKRGDCLIEKRIDGLGSAIFKRAGSNRSAEMELGESFSARVQRRCQEMMISPSTTVRSV